MKKRQMHRTAAAAIALASAVSTASADDLYWLGGTADFGSTNYIGVIGGMNVAPTLADTLYIGEDGLAHHDAADPTPIVDVGRLRVGHAFPGGGTEGLPGTGTLDITGGTVSTTLGATGGSGSNAGLIIGYNADGTLNLSGGTLNVNRLVNVGFETSTDTITGTGTGNLNVSGDGALNITFGNLGAGDNLAGNITVSGNGAITIAEAAADLVVGVSVASTYTQTGGAVTVGDVTFVGRRNADGTSFTLSGGTYTTGGAFLVGDGTVAQGGTDNVTVTVSGTGELTTGSSLTIGDNIGANTTFLVTGGAVHVATNPLVGDPLTRNDIIVGAGSSTVGNTNATLTIENGLVEVDRHVFLGRQFSTNTTLNLSGGTLRMGELFLMSSTQAASPLCTSFVHHSGGLLDVGTNLVLADTGGESTYNLSGTGVIDAGRGIIGRRGIGIFNQTGGTAGFTTTGLNVGESQPTLPEHTSNGLYDISGGTLSATATGNALTIGNAGTGKFRVTGDGATINVTGNMLTNNTARGVGTLSYRLEGTEGLSTIDVTGTATFASGSVVELDLNAIDPTPTSFDLVDAADIANNGFAPTAPAGWFYEVVLGGAGEILRAVEGTAVTTTGWANDAAGNWSQSPNWTGGVPHAAGNEALFGAAILQPRTVTLDGNQMAGKLTFDNANSYTVAGASTLTVDTNGAVGAIDVLQGSHAITAPIHLDRNSTVTVNTGATLGISAMTGNAGVTLTKAGDGTLEMTRVITDGVDVQGGTLTVLPNGGAAGMSIVKSVAVSAGLLNLSDNDLIVDYAEAGPSPEFALRDLVKAVAEGGLTGIGFDAGDGNRVIAIAEGTESGLADLNGVVFDATTVIGKYTYYGDANLDGQVTSDDYVAVDVGIGVGNSWVEGDFDFSGTVTSDDYVAIDVNLGQGSGDPLAWSELKAEMVALHTAMFGDSYVQKLAIAEADGFAALVPEPGSLSLIGLAGAGLLGRRRRRA